MLFYTFEVLIIVVCIISGISKRYAANLNLRYKMDEEIIMLGDIKVEKHKFHQHKNSILIYDLNIDRIVVSNEVPSGKNFLNILLGKKMMMKKSCPCI